MNKIDFAEYHLLRGYRKAMKKEYKRYKRQYKSLTEQMRRLKSGDPESKFSKLSLIGK